MAMQRIEADVVIVGSGAGGGTVAARLGKLAREGKRVLVLEQGPRFDHHQFNGRESEMGDHLYRDGGAFMNAEKTVSLAFAEGYGGSTQVYTGSSLEPAERVISEWNVPGLEHGDLITRIRRYSEQNNVAPVPEDRLNDNNRLFVAGCEKLGWQAERFPLNLKGCKGSSLCNLGCPNNAKQGTHAVQLPAAEAAGVEVVTRARVNRIGKDRLEVSVDASPHSLGDQSEWAGGDYEIHAPTIVLAAGAVNSPALLLRSGYGRDLPALGRWWTCQPAHILVARHESPLVNDVGHPKSFLWDERIESERQFLEVCMYPPFITAKNMSGFGPDHEYFLRQFDHLQMILVLACDKASPDQRVKIDHDGQPVVDYRLTPETIRALVDGTRAAARIFFAAGATDVHAPSGRPMRLTREHADTIDERITPGNFHTGTISVSAAHLMGGCRMGADAKTSVTDAHGQVHEQPGLFVADASLFPAAVETNPYQTVMALADRVADRVIERH